MIQIRLPEQVRHIIRILEEDGEEAYAVGGCVRDSMLGLTPKDWDITTSAPPQKVKQLFHHTVDTGIAHGTVTVLLGQNGYEVTTYRIDGEYTDSRHPRQVIFTSRLCEDLKRRDFTINAMAYNDCIGLVDLFHGQEDLERRMIRCVGEPEERFAEDALRIMRAVRFSAQLHFEIEDRTAEAASRLAPTLKKISAERVRDELVKLLTSNHPEKILLMYQLGITGIVLPEFDAIMEQPQNGPHHDRSAGEHTILALCACRSDRILRLTMLLHDMGKPQCAVCNDQGIWKFPGHASESAKVAQKILRRLKCDNDTISAVTVLVQNHSVYPPLTEEGVRRSICLTGRKLYPLFLEVKRADILAQKKETQKERLDHMKQVEEICRRIEQRGDCLSLKELKISGNDLIKDGMKPGRELGQILEKLLDDVLTFPDHNTEEYLLSASRKLRNKDEIYSDTGKGNE